MKKIMHIGLCVYPDRESSLSAAFKRATNNYVELSLSEKHLQQKAIIMAESFKPDLVFLQLQAADILTLETIKEINKHSKCIVNWTGDVRQNTPQWMQEVAPYCISSFTNMYDVKFIRSIGAKAEFVQIGYDETIYYPQSLQTKIPNKDIDIVFMGNNYGNQFPLSKKRSEMVSFLRDTYGKRFKVFGNFHKADGNVNHSQHEEAAIYRRSRIGINMSHFNLERYSSDRMLRIMGCGTLCLTHRFKGIEQDFKDGENVVIWETFADLKSRIDYYLSHPDEAEKIGMAGEKLVMERNTFDHMVTDLIKLIE